MFVLFFFQAGLMIASQMLLILIFLIEMVDRHTQGTFWPQENSAKMDTSK